MSRSKMITVALLAIAGALGLAWATRAPDDQPAQPASSTAMNAADKPPVTPATAVAPAVPPVDAGKISADQQVAVWIAETQSDDAARRAAAITALADAPRLAAIPALKNVLTTGEAGVDRPLALKSLQLLAVRQGDADGMIRDVLRAAIYHGDGGDLAGQAQSALDAVEASLTGARQGG